MGEMTGPLNEKALQELAEMFEKAEKLDASVRAETERPKPPPMLKALEAKVQKDMERDHRRLRIILFPVVFVHWLYRRLKRKKD